MFLQKQIFMVSDECTLLKQFKSGEREAFDRLFKMYAPQLGYFCLRLVRQEDAEEIVTISDAVETLRRATKGKRNGK